MLLLREQLLTACSDGDTSKLRELLQVSSDPASTISTQNLVPFDQALIDEMLEKAVQSTHVEVVELILQVYPEAAIPEEALRNIVTYRQIPLYKAFLHHDPDITKMTFYDGRETQIGKALATGVEPDFVEFLLSVGVSPNVHPDDCAYNPLGMVAGRWQTKPLELAALLLQHGARLKNSGAVTAAAMNGRKDLVDFLLIQGADVNDVDCGSPTLHRSPALHAAMKKGHRDVVQVLLDAGFDCNILDGDGKTAQEIAEAKDDKDMIDMIRGRRKMPEQ